MSKSTIQGGNVLKSKCFEAAKIPGNIRYWKRNFAKKEKKLQIFFKKLMPLLTGMLSSTVIKIHFTVPSRSVLVN